MATTIESRSRQPDGKRETYSFVLRLSGFSEITEDVENALYNAGCGDALLSVCDRQPILEFDRVAGSLAEAILSAIRAIEGTQLGIRVTQVVPAGEMVIATFNGLLRLRGEFPDMAAELEKAMGRLSERHGL